MMAEKIFMQPIVQALGLALVHFIWQGAGLALITASALALLRNYGAHTRYLVATAGLSLMLAAPVITVSRVYSSIPSEAFEQGQSADFMADGRAAGSRASLPGASKVSQADEQGAVQRPTSFASLDNLAEGRFASLARLFVLFWLCGIIFFSTRLLSGWVATERLKRRGTGRVSAACEEMFAHLARSLKVSRPVRLYKSVLVEVPTVIGWLRPVILVPVSAFTGLSREQLEALLAHELAHVRRYDYLVNLLQAVAESLLFYHPAVWWVSNQIRAEREHACDDIAVEACGDALVYARALAELESLRGEDGHTLALAATGGKGSLIKRIRRLIHAPAREEQRHPARLAALLLFVSLSGALFVAQGALFMAAPPEGLTADPLASRRQVAVTFLSLPYFRGGDESIESLNQTNTKLLDAMAARNIKAVGFVGEGALYKEGQTEARVSLLRRWLEAGHELGNQGYKHLSLFNTPLADYEANVLKGEQVTRPLMQEYGKQLRYYSYPYLNTGPTPETKKAFEQFLSEHSYQIHAITIDNMDWIFSNAYLEARRRGEAEVMKRISDEYVAYMESVFAHYERLSQKTFGHEIPQILMLETSALNADNFDRLAEMLKRRGYSFITMEEALKDPAFSTPTNYTGPWGISWIERWAKDKGLDIKGDPMLPQYMLQFGKDGLKNPNKLQ